MVRLLFGDQPRFDPEEVARLASVRSDTPTTIVGDEPMVGVSFPERLVHFDDAEIPMVVWIGAGEQGVSVQSMQEILRQSWSWPDAESVVRGLDHALSVTDIMAGPLDRGVRLPLYHSVLGALVETSHPIATEWLIGQRYLQPDSYLLDLKGDPAALRSTLNVRYITLADHPGEQLMDTVGLACLGLPDVQMHFTDLDPGWVANKLLSVGIYLFEKGDVIEDGHTVPGVSDDERWPCAHEAAMLGPNREVLDINAFPHGPARA
jgi:hypothetical protein